VTRSCIITANRSAALFTKGGRDLRDVRLLLGVGVWTREERIGDRLCRCGLTWPCSLISDRLKMCLLLTRYLLILLLFL
jgi:hypothetical protein